MPNYEEGIEFMLSNNYDSLILPRSRKSEIQYFKAECLFLIAEKEREEREINYNFEYADLKYFVYVKDHLQKLRLLLYYYTTLERNNDV